MFSLFKKRKPENPFAAMLELADATYVSAVVDLFETMDPATRANVLVAYQNLVPLLSATWSASKRQGEEFTVEKFIPLVAEKLNSSVGDEVGSRRWSWFLFASLLGRLEKLTLKQPHHAEAGAKIWCSIAEDAPLLKGLLPRNIVWRAEEKGWFDLSLSDQDMVQWTINHGAPPIFSNHEYASSFTHSRGLFYWPSKARVGTIP